MQKNFFEKPLSEAEDIFVSSIVLGELYYGAEKLEFRQRIPNVNTTGSKNHLSKRLFRQQV